MGISFRSCSWEIHNDALKTKRSQTLFQKKAPCHQRFECSFPAKLPNLQQKRQTTAKALIFWKSKRKLREKSPDQTALQQSWEDWYLWKISNIIFAMSCQQKDTRRKCDPKIYHHVCKVYTIVN